MAKLDLSKFKKVGGDKNFTIMRHKDGHVMKIAHAPLSAKMRGELDALPNMQKEGNQASKVPNFSSSLPHLDEGGDVKKDSDDSNPEPSPSPGGIGTGATSYGTDNPVAKGIAKTFQAKGGAIKERANYDDGGGIGQTIGKLLPLALMANKGGAIKDPTQEHLLPGDKIPNAIEKKVVKRAKYDDGGPVSSSEQDTPAQIASDAASQSDAGTQAAPTDQTQASTPDQQDNSAPAVDPDVADTRNIYNRQIQILSNMPGDPDEKQRIQAAQFGPNGEPPANFNADVYQRAMALKQAADTQGANAKTAAIEQAIKQNQVRVQAGLAPIPLPEDQSQGNGGTSQPQQDVKNLAPLAATAPAPEDQAQPGDKELATLEASRNLPSAGGAPQTGGGAAPSPTQGGTQQQQQGMSPAQTMQALQTAKAMTYNQLMKERQNWIQQLQSGVKPETMGQMFADKNLLGKMGMVAGLALGGISSGVTGRENPAISMYENMVNNDLRAQQLNLANKQGLLSNNLQLIGNLPDAIKFSKVQMMDAQMHQLAQLAQKYPNNPQIQQQLQAVGMMGAQSSSNLMDTVSANLAWRHAVTEIQDPAQKIQFNPLMTPEQKTGALKDLGTYQNMSRMRTNALNAYDTVAKMPLGGMTNPNQRDALIQPVLAQMVKDSEGRITPTDIPMISSLFPKSTDIGANTRNIKRSQLVKFLSEKMNFPSLNMAGINTSTPPPVTAGPPKIK